jgi:transposase
LNWCDFSSLFRHFGGTFSGQLRTIGMRTEAAISPPANLPRLDNLPDDPALLKQMITELLLTLDAQRRDREQIQHRLDLLLRRIYGPRSERINPDQLLLFADLLAAAEPQKPVAAAIEEALEATPVIRKSRGHGRRELPANLPRIPVVHDLAEAEKPCPDCGQVRHKIGEEKTEQLDYRPAALFVLEHVRPKYACGHCAGQVAAAVKPPQPIAKGLPGPGLLAYVAVSKYGDHLPLYRLERILTRFGVNLSRSTLCDWMGRCGMLLQPLYQSMIRSVLASQVIHTDDTPVPVLDPELDHTRTGRLWVYLGDATHPYNVFAFTPNRKRDGPAEFLKDFKGYLQADAFGGYDGIYATQEVDEVGCHAHARRKFHEARTSSAAAAHQALAYYRQLYEIEQAATAAAQEALRVQPATNLDELLSIHRLRLRRERAVPVLAEFHSWLLAQQVDALPKSPLGQAVGYALNQWEALTLYTTQGFLQIDNNVAEREMKRVAIGRKNWMFAGSDQGGATAAVLFSVVSSCQRHGLDPFFYLRDVLANLPGLRPDQIDSLLPDRWAKAQKPDDQPAQNN